MTISEERRIVTKRLRERPRRLVDRRRHGSGGAVRGVGATSRARATPPKCRSLCRSRASAGRGRRRFSTGQKWSFLPADLLPRYLAVNGDEGEPSTFEDQILVEHDPHQLIEGIVISSVHDPVQTRRSSTCAVSSHSATTV